jgi:hypothetical protein
VSSVAGRAKVILDIKHALPRALTADPVLAAKGSLDDAPQPAGASRPRSALA